MKCRFLQFVLFLYMTFCCVQELLAALTKLDQIKARLEAGAVQEKVYLHIDNNCYFKGDTIWYKAYVVRADDLHYTDMSRIVYVELVSPDGLVVERQNLIASDEGYGDGNFVLTDSIYSGYYELRAYTRWMLNFNVAEHPNQLHDRRMFYNNRMAQDFFRDYESLYSRVVPVYERPSEPGAYDLRSIMERPKMRLDKEPEETLKVSFYPEGGNLIASRRCRVAFEAVDAEGRCVDRLTGSIGNKQIATLHEGRGVFEVEVPEDKPLRATFVYHGKEYQFELPKARKTGCSLRVDQTEDSLFIEVETQSLLPSDALGLAVLCRGRMQHFEVLGCESASRNDLTGEKYLLSLGKTQLKTGVNDVIVLRADGSPLADRLVFVNNHDYDQQLVCLEESSVELHPLEQVSLKLQAPTSAHHLSVSVRDSRTDERVFDTGTMLTDLLLDSELKGFVPHADYYFADASPELAAALDLLMMVQGWRRYDYEALISNEPLRYAPEVCLTVEGNVYETVDFMTAEEEEAASIFAEEQEMVDALREDNDMDRVATINAPNNSHYGFDHSKLKHEVTLVGELMLGDEIADVEMQTTDSGHYLINIPPYLGDAILHLYAHKTEISDKRLKKIQHKDRNNEEAWPDFYVKRDLFYPVFAQPYNYYQCHLPEVDIAFIDNGLSDEANERLSDIDKRLANVDVKGKRRRGSRKIDLKKPAFVMDAYELYNLVTDRGISYGKFNFNRLAADACMALLGNYNNSERPVNIECRMEGDVISRNFSQMTGDSLGLVKHKGDYAYRRNKYLRRLQELHFFTDFELRNYEQPLTRSLNLPDVIIDYIPMPNDTERHSFRDRQIVLPGIYKASDFYHPDYGKRPLPEGASDYRRTLYWNPNLVPDEEGQCEIRFYNNSTAQNLRVSVAGLTDDGRPVVLEQELGKDQCQ